MKRIIIGFVSVAALFVAFIAQINNPQSTDKSNVQTTSINHAVETPKAKIKTKPICNGSTVTAHCALDGINYATYIYHPAVPKETHTETVTTYQKKITSYCTLCSDGSYSPTCATGRGACSHHGGVAQWNAPRYSSVPKYSTKTIVDAPAQKAYYEKVTE